MSIKTISHIGLCLFLLLSFANTVPAANEGTYGPQGPPADMRAMSPQWEQGDTWTIKTFYRSLHLGKKNRKNQRGRSELAREAFWTYKVTKTRDYNKAELVRVQVKDNNKKRSEIASLTYGRQHIGDSKTSFTSLLRGRFLRKFRGESEKSETIISEPGHMPNPALTQHTSIPFDTPVFPIGLKDPESVKQSGSREKGLSRYTLFTITEDTGKGGFKYAMDIEQREYLDPDIDKFMWKGAKKELEENGYPTSGLIGIKLFRPFDNVQVRQIWHPKAPWPLLSYGPWHRSVMVYYSGEGR